MLLFCDARPLDASMALSSMALVSVDDAHVFEASSADDPAVIRQALRDFVRRVTEADGGVQPCVVIEGFAADRPVPMQVFEEVHGLFPSKMGPLVRWFDAACVIGIHRSAGADALTVARLLRDDHVRREAKRQYVSG